MAAQEILNVLDLFIPKADVAERAAVELVAGLDGVPGANQSVRHTLTVLDDELKLAIFDRQRAAGAAKPRRKRD